MDEDFLFDGCKIDLKSINSTIEMFKQIEYNFLKSLGDTEAFHEIYNCHKNKQNHQRLELDRTFEIDLEKQIDLFEESLNISQYHSKVEILKELDFPSSLKNKFRDYEELEKHFSKPIPKHELLNKIEIGNTNPTKEEDLVVGESIILTINVYQSNYKYIKGMKNPPKIKLSQTLLLNGKSTLADLRDMIFCEHDHIANIKPPYEVLKEIFPSSMFYMCNSFYIDTRNPENKDYSIVIKEWAKEKNIEVGDTFCMENTLVEDMNLRLCYPELFIHLGDCEHFITVRECRLLHPEDCKISSYYPFMTALARRRTKFCALCNKPPIEFIIIKSKKVFEENVSVCRLCYEQYFLVNGQVLEPNAKCFLYIDRSSVLAKLN